VVKFFFNAVVAFNAAVVLNAVVVTNPEVIDANVFIDGMGNVRDVVAPNISKRPQILFIFIILMYLCNLSPSH